MTQPNSAPPISLEELQAAAFPMNRGAGYDTEDVDTFIDEAVRAFEASPEEQTAFRDRLAKVQFRGARHASYDPPAVDDLVDQLEATFGGPPLPSLLSTEDRSALAQQVAATKIPLANASGYDVVAVDGFVADTQKVLLDPSADLGTLRGRLDTLRFHMMRGSGYEVLAVDELVDHLLETLRAYPSTPPAEFSGDERLEAEELAGVSMKPRGSRFRTTGFFSSGWQFAAVDEFVEQVASSITVPDNVLRSDDIRAATFPPDKSGYRMKDVKAWLVDVEQHLGSRLR